MSRPQTNPFGVRFVAPLAFASTLNPINSSLISTAMVPIAQAVHATAADTAWLITGLYLASAVAQPTAGKLADLLGPKRVLVGALGLVAVAGLVGSLATGLPMLIVTRVLIGIGTSGAYPAAMRMFRDRGQQAGTPPPRTAMSVLTLCSLSVAAIGPLMGGILTASFGWHAVFAVNLPCALLAMGLVLLWSPADAPRTFQASRFLADIDGVGLALFVTLLISAMLVLMRLSQPNWPALVVALVSGPALAVWSFRRPAPFFDLPMLVHNRALTATYVRFGAIMMLTYAVFYGFAQWVQTAGGYSPSQSGLLTIPMSLLGAGATFGAARTRSIRTPFLVACGSALAGSLALLFLQGTSPPWMLAAAVALFGLPLGMTSTATQAAVYLQAPPETMGSAAGLQRTAAYLGSITAASLIALCFGAKPTNGGFHLLMAVLVGVSGVLFLAIGIDPTLPRAHPAAPAGDRPA